MNVNGLEKEVPTRTIAGNQSYFTVWFNFGFTVNFSKI